MTVRSSMGYLINEIRNLINDPSSATEKFSDQDIQDRLDTMRLDLYQDDLHEADTLTSSGTIEWHDYFSEFGYWETDYVIQKLNGTIMAPNTEEPRIGKWHFNTALTEPLVITGKVYNVYGVASSLLNTWIAEERKQITSWTADGTTVQRLYNMKSLVDLSQNYAARAFGWGRGKFNQVKLVRRDLRN